MSYNDKQKVFLSKFKIDDVKNPITSKSISSIMDRLQDETPKKTIMEKMEEINRAVDKVKYLMNEKIDLDVIYPSLSPEEKYDGNPNKEQYCPVCKEMVMPEMIDYTSQNGADDFDTHYRIFCKKCNYSFDED